MNGSPLRALTRYMVNCDVGSKDRRNEWKPVEGIDTFLPRQMLPEQLCRNEWKPVEGIDTWLKLKILFDIYRRNEWKPVEGIDTPHLKHQGLPLFR